MDYKKIIAATAVTSAAFVVPVVVGAEASAEQILVDLTEGASVQVGQELVVSKKDGENEIAFEWYKWSVVDAEGNSVQQPVTTAKFTPTYNVLGSQIKVEAKVKDSEDIYTQTVRVDGVSEIQVDGILPDTPSLFWNDQIIINPINPDGAKFNPSKIAWYVDDVLVGNASTLKIPFGAKVLKAIVVDPSGTEVYVDSITINEPVLTNIQLEYKELTVNSTIEVNLEVAGIIKKIDWYIDGKFYKSGTESIFDIPVIAANKKIHTVVTLETSSNVLNHYVSEGVLVEAITLPDPDTVDKQSISKINNIALADMDDYTLVENDVISVGLPELDVTLTESQMDITYEWYETNGTSLIKIANANTNSYTIPTNLKDKNYNKYIAKMTVVVPGTDVSPHIYYSEVFSLEKTSIEQLIVTIEALKISATVYADDLQTNLQATLSEYNSLSPNAQKLVTNASKLTTAQNDLKLATPVIQSLNSFKLKYDELAGNLELNHKELLKEVAKIDAQIKKLTSLQLSIVNQADFKVEDFVQIKELLNKYTLDFVDEESTTKIVTQLNTEIDELIMGFGTLEAKYVVDRAELQQKIEDLNKRIKTIDKKYVPLIKTTVLKNAESDLKKAERAAKKIQAVTTTEASKKSKAANAALIEFNKLSLLQQSLITPDERELFEPEESDAETKISELTEKIDSIITGEGYNFSSDVFADSTLTQAYEQLVAEYKAFSSKDRKLVKNYAIVTQFGKDIKAATSAKKPLLALDKAMAAYYDEVDEKKQASKMKTAYSKYTAAYKAYTKLTPLQQSILTSPGFIDGLTVDFDYEDYFVYESAKEFEELLSVPEPKEGTNPEKVPSLDNAISVVKLLEGFYNGILAGNYSIDEAKEEIELLKAAYSDLLPAEKKNVYNYSIISTVNSMISKAKSAESKLKNATNEAKLVSAIAAYNKLTDPQKKLISDSYDTAQTQLDTILESKSYSEIEEKIADLQTYYTLENIKAITTDLSNLTSKEQKALKNYKVYTDALKDVKAAEKFFNNVQKQNTALTYSKIEKILKDFNKLSAKQVQLLSGYTLKEANSLDEIPLLDKIQNWNNDMGKSADSLNEKLAKIISFGEYNFDSLKDSDEISDVESLNIAISKVEAEYKALDSKEKKLVTNYSVIKTLTSDLKKVEPVLSLAESFNNASDSQQSGVFKQWQAAYQRLSAKQISLYNVLGGTELSLD